MNKNYNNFLYSIIKFINNKINEIISINSNQELEEHDKIISFDVDDYNSDYTSVDDFFKRCPV